MKKKTWIDGHREPRNPPNSKYPRGIDLDLSKGAIKTCTVELQCPAKRVGNWVVECTDCDLIISCTTAGRVDDPRSVKLACRLH